MHDRRRLLHTMNDTFWVLVLALIVLFAFFVALGAIGPTDVGWLSLLVGVLLVAYLAHAWWAARHAPEGRDPETIRARERRGF